MGRAAITGAVADLVAAALPNAKLHGFTGKPGRPARLTSNGAVVLLSVDGGEPEIDLNPPTYHYEAELALAVLASTRAQAETMFAAIGAGIAADRTLSGACDWADASNPGLDEETMTGADGHFEAHCLVTAAYTTTNPLD